MKLFLDNRSSFEIFQNAHESLQMEYACHCVIYKKNKADNPAKDGEHQMTDVIGLLIWTILLVLTNQCHVSRKKLR